MAAQKEDECIGSDYLDNFMRVCKLIALKIERITGQKVIFTGKESREEIEKLICQQINENIDYAIDAIELRAIADYISGMTDRMAEKKYNEICSSSTQWSKAYTERGTFNV